MARRAIEPEVRQKVMAEIAAGTTKPEVIAVNNGVSVATVRNWAKRAGTSPSEVPLPPVEIKKDGQSKSLEDLIASKLADPAPAITTPDIEANTQAVTPVEEKLDAEALMAMVMVTKSMVVTNCAMVWRVSLTDDQVAKLVDFTEPEQRYLKILAPHAAEYTGAISAYTKPMMAVLFAGVVAMSTTRSIKELRSMKAVDVMKPASKKKGTK